MKQNIYGWIAVFCGISWMDLYQGTESPDHASVGEACNFLPCHDGNVYGSLSALPGQNNPLIDLHRQGPHQHCAHGVDVVWTAVHPSDGTIRLVGWYRQASVFCQPLAFTHPPSAQHDKDGLTHFQIVAAAQDVKLFEPSERIVVLGQPKEQSPWMGDRSWWIPSDADDNSYTAAQTALTVLEGDSAQAAQSISHTLSHLDNRV